MSKSYEQQALAYISMNQRRFGPPSDISDDVILTMRKGDAALAEFAQAGRRSKTGRSGEQDERRRWVYDCAVIGDTIADVMDVDRWRSDLDARQLMLHTLSDYLGIHFMGRDGGSPPMPPIRIREWKRRPRRNGSYREYTRQITIRRSLVDGDHPWAAAHTLVHERAHDWQFRIMHGQVPHGHLLPDKIEAWRRTLNDAYTKQAIEKDAFQTAGLALLRWGRRLDGATGVSPMGLDSRQAMYGIFNSTRETERLSPYRSLLHKLGV